MTYRLESIAAILCLFIIVGCGDGTERGGPASAVSGGSADSASADGARIGDASAVDTGGAVAALGIDPFAFVGLEHPPLPDSIDIRAGALATEPGEPAADADFVFQHVRIGSEEVLWLARITDRNAEGEVSYRVLDAATVSPRSGERLVVGQCRSSDPERTVTAIAAESDEESLTDIRQAWAVDRTREALAAIAPDGIECENEGLRAP